MKLINVRTSTGKLAGILRRTSSFTSYETKIGDRLVTFTIPAGIDFQLTEKPAQTSR